jgi:hypothetical protein
MVNYYPRQGLGAEVGWYREARTGSRMLQAGVV